LNALAVRFDATALASLSYFKVLVLQTYADVSSLILLVWHLLCLLSAVMTRVLPHHQAEFCHNICQYLFMIYVVVLTVSSPAVLLLLLLQAVIDVVRPGIEASLAG
jgi:hypothetical protein